MRSALWPKSASDPLTRVRLSVVLAAAVAGLASFALGFFPLKPLLSGFSKSQNYSRQLDKSSERDAPQSDGFSRLAFVVVDALRSDFAFGPASHMSFVSSLVQSGHALPYTAVAQAPTVTLPRLKALTTGSNPTFVDALLNLAEETTSTAAFENIDSWLRQFALPSNGASPSRMLVFAGDDTWLRLFPREWFVWHEGVSSFFVSDTVTVDSNVTRHLDHLLGEHYLAEEHGSPQRIDWDVLLLHYLGLDHVGHLEGPASPLVAPKQAEMDAVVKRLYEHLERRDQADGQRSLLVLLGDHGMTEGGNHGGSTEAETSAALLLAAPSLRLSESVTPVTHDSPYRHFEVVQQLDVVPTLSVLFDLGIPRNSAGKLIYSAIQALRPDALLSGLEENVQQIGDVLFASGSGVLERALAESAATVGGTHSSLAELLHEGSIPEQYSFLSAAQTRILASSSSYRLDYLFLGIAGLTAASAASLYRVRLLWSVESSKVRLAVAAALGAFLASLFATSFIEEEHEFWYFMSATALLLLATSPDQGIVDRVLLVACAASVRAMRSWAHNGQKNVPNVSLAAHLSAFPRLLGALIAMTYALPPILAFIALVRDSRSIRRQRLSPLALLRRAALFAVQATIAVGQSVVGVAMHLMQLEGGHKSGLFSGALDKLDLADPGTLARGVYMLAAIGWLVWRTTRTIHTSKILPLVHFSLLLMSLTRPANVPLFMAFWIQHFTISRLADKPSASPAVLSLLVVALQSSAFFGLGGSNSLATADLSQAYNGLESFSLPIVGLLAFLSNFSGPIFLSLSLQTYSPVLRTFILDYLTAFHTLALSMLAISATHFRYHLFALTVFAPAVLYRASWFLSVQVGLKLGLARGLVG